MLQIEVECARVAVVSVLGSHSSAKRAATPFSKKVLLIDIVTTERDRCTGVAGFVSCLFPFASRGKLEFVVLSASQLCVTN